MFHPILPHFFRHPTAFAVLILAFASFCISPGLANAQDDDRSGEAIALFNKGQDAHEKGDLAEAIKLYDQALVIIPEFPEAELQRGNAFLSLGRAGDAEKAFRHAVALREDWTTALAALGSVLVQVGRYADAEPYLVKAVELDDQNFPAFAALTELRLKTNAKRNVLDDLLTKIKRLTEKARPPASAWAARAALERAVGDAGSAKQSLAIALKLEPASLTALTASSELALEENDPAGAEGFVKRLEAISPGTDSTKFLRTRVLLAQGKIDEGSKLLDSIKNSSPEVVSLKNTVAAARGQRTLGRSKKALESNPKNAVVLGRLCSALRTTDPEKAIDFCRRAVEADPGNISYAIGFGAALVQAKRYADAAGVLTKLVSVAPENATAHANLATALFQLKRYPEAKIEYRWLIGKQPDLAAAYYFLGITHDELGEYMDAMANYQQFLRLADPAASKLEIEKVNLRLPMLQKQLKGGKEKRNG